MNVSELLALSKAPPPRGRKRKEVSADYDRDLEQKDIETLALLKDGDLGARTPPLQKLRHRHHHLARALAQGASEAEASLITGYQVASISILKNDPAFKELLGYYQAQKEEILVDFFERLKMLGLHTVDELLDRLDARPDEFSNEELQKLLEAAADRTGFGPTKSTNVTGVFGLVNADAISRIKTEVSKRQNGTVEKLNAPGATPALGQPLIQKSLAEEAEILESSESGDQV